MSVHWRTGFKSFHAEKLFVANELENEQYLVLACRDGTLEVYSWNEWNLLLKTLSLKDAYYGKSKRDECKLMPFQ